MGIIIQHFFVESFLLQKNLSRKMMCNINKIWRIGVFNYEKSFAIVVCGKLFSWSVLLCVCVQKLFFLPIIEFSQEMLPKLVGKN
jgi:hypothetical protein